MLASAILAGCDATPGAAPKATSSPTPVGTYAQQRCDGSPADWLKEGGESGELMTYNKIAVSPAGVRWNGAPIDHSTLATYLTQIRQIDPEPVTVLLLSADAACSAVVPLRQLIEQKLQCRSAPSHCVEYAEVDWIKAHPPVPAPGNTAGD